MEKVIFILAIYYIYIYIKYINVVAIVVFVAADEAIHLVVIVNC